jgi:cell wall-associated NlpC family hydrolase
LIDVDELIAQARSWLGVPYLHQGRSRNGADCLGFLACMLAELGSRTFLDALPNNYPRNPQSILAVAAPKLATPLEVEVPGALVLFQFPLTKYPSHAGILTRDGTFIHTFEPVKRVVEVGYRAPWPARARSVWAAPLVMYQ